MMVFGHNSNVKVGMHTFHVQTEDRGVNHALIDTTVYYRGRVLHRRTNNYFDLLPMNEDREEALRLRVDAGPDGGTRIAVDGEDVTDALRSVEVNRAVGKVAAVPAVRAALRDLQRSLGRAGSVVMDGRDIGSVILPEAQVKVFLTAALDVRARRRQAELAAAGHAVSVEEVRRIQAEDDQTALTRAVAPLTVAPGAVVLDSTDLTIEQVVDRIVALVDAARGL
jgi:cytidylate kinase